MTPLKCLRMPLIYYKTLYILEPNAVPQNITAVWSSSTTIKVTWTPLTLYESRGHIISYTISYSSMTTGLTRQSVFNVGSAHNTTEEKLEDLQASTTYLVQMWTSTIAGPGPTSPAIVIPPPSPGTWSSQIISAIAGAAVAVVFLITVATVIVAIIVRKYQQNLQTFQHK